MFYSMAFLSVLSIIFIFYSTVHGAEAWPGPGVGPQDLKAFPSKIECQLEVVFTRDDFTNKFTVFGLYDDSNGPIELEKVEIQNGKTSPITVVNGDATDDSGVYQELASNTRYVVLIVDYCANQTKHGKFQNDIFIRSSPEGTGGANVWESDHVILKEEKIPNPGVKLLNVSAEKNLVLNSQPDQDFSYTVNLHWSIDETINAKEVDGFWALAAYNGSGQHFIKSLYWPLKDQYGGPNNGNGYVNFGIPSTFDFEKDQNFVAAISIQTTQGAFSDPITCPQLSFTIPKENPK